MNTLITKKINLSLLYVDQNIKQKVAIFPQNTSKLHKTPLIFTQNEDYIN